MMVSIDTTASEISSLHGVIFSSKHRIKKCGLHKFVFLSALTQCGLVTPYGNIELGQYNAGIGLVPEGTESSPEPMLTYHQ